MLYRMYMKHTCFPFKLVWSDSGPKAGSVHQQTFPEVEEQATWVAQTSVHYVWKKLALGRRFSEVQHGGGEVYS